MKTHVSDTLHLGGESHSLPGTGLGDTVTRDVCALLVGSKGERGELSLRLGDAQ